ncbi:uncharacterized protein RAG0_13366 [Rhynchosporium agropyri]|uniref:Uncharacterized protein n=1 Tax=Rhynchosporium agropyri TaxID=914238 RepID=A0A1E1LCF8_9HELO|nr:uncharacterized protein RAG0_13366 [Rhynchosporium agropyri]
MYIDPKSNPSLVRFIVVEVVDIELYIASTYLAYSSNYPSTGYEISKLKVNFSGAVRSKGSVTKPQNPQVLNSDGLSCSKTIDPTGEHRCRTSDRAQGVKQNPPGLINSFLSLLRTPNPIESQPHNQSKNGGNHFTSLSPHLASLRVVMMNDFVQKLQTPISH